jgi:hypothetical protein
MKTHTMTEKREMGNVGSCRARSLNSTEIIEEHTEDECQNERRVGIDLI